MATTVEDILKKCDYYCYTVNTLLCFISLSCWEREPEVKYSFGRRMSTSPENKIKKNEDITPDAIIQLSGELGLIAEIKVSLPEAKEYWRKEVDQLLKYDDKLQGWWTSDEYIANYNVIFLVELGRCIEFKTYLSNLKNNNEIYYDDSLCGISFVRTPGLNEQIFFEPRWGKIKDPQLSAKLENGKYVPLEKVRASYGNIKFCDSEPEIEYLISIIWNDIFNIRKNDAAFDQKTKMFLIDVDIKELAYELQRSFGCILLRAGAIGIQNEHRQREYPKISWVRKALDFLVTYGFAKQISEDNYTVFYKLISKDLIPYFAKRRAKEKAKIVEDEEPSLFKDIESP